MRRFNMKNKAIKNTISIMVIIVMVGGIFTMPVLTGNSDVDAATKKVKVIYKANEGKFTAKAYAKKKAVIKKIKIGKKRGTAPKIKRTGYTLKGWYTQKSGGKKYTKNTKIKKGTTLYARWSPKKYTVKFDFQGGSSATKSKDVTYKKKYGTLPTPTKMTHEFLGWYTSASGGTKITNKSVYDKAKNITLYARWEQKLTWNNSKGLFNMEYSKVKQYLPTLTVTRYDENNNPSEATLPTGERLFFDVYGTDSLCKLSALVSTAGRYFDVKSIISFEEFASMINARFMGADTGLSDFYYSGKDGSFLISMGSSVAISPATTFRIFKY